MISDLIVEEAAWPDSAPDQTRVKMRPGEWAAESIHCVVGADALDIAQAPIEDAYTA